MLDWEKFEKEFADDEDPNATKKITPLDEGDIQILKSYGQGPYARALKTLDDEIKEVTKRVDEKIGVKESDMGLAPPNLWDLLSDRQRMSEEHPLQVARCTKIIQNPDDPEKGKYVINVKQMAKFGIYPLTSAPCPSIGPPFRDVRRMETNCSCESRGTGVAYGYRGGDESWR
jgi:26S proteasome regulatory subunit T1